MDEQHKRLIDLINQLHQAMEDGSAREGIGDIINDLYEYAKTHFNDEDILLEKYNYQKIEQHKRAHRNLYFMVERYQDMFQQDTHSINEFAHFMANWLFDHLMVDDKEYSQIITNKERIQPA